MAALGMPLWHVGEWWWTELQRLQNPELCQLKIVPVLVEEILGALYVPKGNQRRHNDVPTMIQISPGLDPSNPKSALMLL